MQKKGPKKQDFGILAAGLPRHTVRPLLRFAATLPRAQWHKLDGPPCGQYQRDVPYFSILVPTSETTIFSTFLRNLLSVQRHVLVNGPTGVGKSQVISSFLLEGLRSDSPDSGYAAFDITFRHVRPCCSLR